MFTLSGMKIKTEEYSARRKFVNKNKALEPLRNVWYIKQYMLA